MPMQLQHLCMQFWCSTISRQPKQHCSRPPWQALQRLFSAVACSLLHVLAPCKQCRHANQALQQM